jgi:transitional endoplasmic reticulum ATPase
VDGHIAQVPLPDEVARRAILQARLRWVPAAPGVDVAALAALTGGLSGADLAEVVRRAGQLALRSVQGGCVGS